MLYVIEIGETWEQSVPHELAFIDYNSEFEAECDALERSFAMIEEHFSNDVKHCAEYYAEQSGDTWDYFYNEILRDCAWYKVMPYV